jgi:hypothetical protein
MLGKHSTIGDKLQVLKIPLMAICNGLNVSLKVHVLPVQQCWEMGPIRGDQVWKLCLPEWINAVSLRMGYLGVGFW